MNYYEHHLGDYLRDTAHLSLLEDAAYRRLLDAYYVREKPLPADVKECCKLARAIAKPERAAVAYVLGQFFRLQDDGYHQSRADGEIARFREKSMKATESANARWGKSNGNANAYANGHANASKTHMPSQSVGNALQSPVSSLQSKSKIPEKNTTAAERPKNPIEFEDLKLIYPKRGGDNPWPRAFKACVARLKTGSSWIDMLDGTRRYQRYCRETHKIGTEFVMQAATFFGPDRRFLENWDLPANKAEVVRDSNLSASQDWLNANR